MIRRIITTEFLESAAEYPVVTVFGPRQSGKTTLARMTFPDKRYYSLENPDIRMAAESDPKGFLTQLPEGGILDEIQRLPLLLSYIQGVVDDARKPGMFILTGSHQPELHQSVSQSLAGRTAVLNLLPFSHEELLNYNEKANAFDMIVNGLFPGVHENRLSPSRFFNGYLQTYIERDIRALINLKDLSSFQQFLMLLAGRIGQVVNYNALSNDVGVSATTIKSWISVLKASFVVFELPPFFENIRKRVVKSPKLYFCDPGLAAFLLNIENTDQLLRDPLRGGLYENLWILDVLKARFNQGKKPDLFFYRDTNGNEVDLLVRQGRQLVPVEIKSAATFTPDFLKGVERFQKVVGDRCLPGFVVYNGNERFSVKGNTVLNPVLHRGLKKI